MYGEAERQAAAALDDGAAERRALEEAVLAGGSGAGPGPCPSRLQRSIEGLHAANICAIQCWPGRREAVTGSSDGTLHVLSYIGELRRAIAASSSGVLALGLQGGAGSVVAAGCMDGSIVVVDAGTGVVLARAQPHRKYVVACRWAPDGRHLATGAWDDSFAVGGGGEGGRRRACLCLT